MRGYGWPPDYVLYELPSAQGWACRAWLIETDADLEVERKSAGYLGQEVARQTAGGRLETGGGMARKKTEDGRRKTETAEITVAT